MKPFKSNVLLHKITDLNLKISQSDLKIPQIKSDLTVQDN